MTASQHIETSGIIDIPFRELPKLLIPGNPYLVLFEKNREVIVDDFFQTIFAKLEQRKFETLGGTFFTVKNISIYKTRRATISNYSTKH